MLSFEEKRAIFRSFNLEEKQTSNGRINFHYPESKQRGQVVGTQLHTSGNGYVIGKYLSPDTINRYGYKIDSRGWITIKEFTKEQLTDVISEAIKSMSVVENHDEFLQEDLLAVQVEGDNNEEKLFENENIPSLNDVRKSNCVSRWLWWTKTVLEFNRIIWGGSSIERK